MVSKRIFVVFVLPVIFSIIVGSIVLGGVLQKPDRELNMWSTSFSEGGEFYSSPIKIIGLSKQYSTSEHVEIQVKIDNLSFSCGDLYITIYAVEKRDIITQKRFFEQCFTSGNNIIPIGESFSEVITIPGSYEIVIEMISKQLKNISIKGTFTVK